MDNSKDTSGSPTRIRDWLAIGITLGSIAALLVLGLVAVYRASSVDDTLKVINILLPVLATWVGTVIAFYFSKENFESAARNINELTKQLTSEEKLKSIPAKSVMLPIEKVSKLVLNTTPDKIKLKADVLDAILAKNNVNRLPVLIDSGIPSYMIHRSTLEQFIVSQVVKGRKVEELTLQDMLDDPEFSAKVREGAFVTIKDTATLGEAKLLMDQNRNCADIFITDDGGRTGKVLGWITNGIILEQSRV